MRRAAGGLALVPAAQPLHEARVDAAEAVERAGDLDNNMCSYSV